MKFMPSQLSYFLRHAQVKKETGMVLLSLKRYLSTFDYRTIMQSARGLMNIKSLCILTVLLVPLMSPAAEYPGCDVKKDVRIAYSGKQPDDTLSVRIKGQPCYEATLSIRITGKNGKVLYAYRKPFKSHVSTQWDDKTLDEDAKDFADRIAHLDSFKPTGLLPAWKPADEYYEDYYQEIKVEKAYYEMLRKQKWQTYTHPIHYEGWKVIVYDRQKQQTVEVSSGGL